MRSLCKWFMVLGVAALVASPVLAQGRGQRGGGFGGPGQLVTQEPVQKDLKITAEEGTKAAETAREVRGRFQDDFAKLQDLDPQERFPKQMELTTKVNDETYKALETVLKPDQVKRLKQIGIQAQGLQAFMSPSVQTALKLTGEQKEKVQSIQMSQMGQMREIFEAGGDPQDNQKKIADMRKKGLDEAMALLTDSQKTEWKELTGAPFDTSKLQMGMGGRGKRKDKGN